MADDITVMSAAKQQRYFARQFKEAIDAYVSKDEAITGVGLVALVNEHLHGTPAQKMMVLGMVGKVMANELATPAKEEKAPFDAPWLKRSRLAYQDPQRLAEVRAESRDTIIDVPSKQVG